MNSDSQGNTATRPVTGTTLAVERTFMAHERTQMAWVRTALSLISFGFTIAKIFEYLHKEERPRGPVLGAHTVGILMISIGLLSLSLAGVQHGRALRALRDQCPGLPVSMAGLASALIAFLGILALISAVLRQ